MFLKKFITTNSSNVHVITNYKENTYESKEENPLD
jgi:hypothetical protein